MSCINAIKNGFIALILALAIIPVSVYADDVEDSINEALQAYKKGELKEAVESLNYASQLVQQKRGGGLESLLPDPLKGWTAKAASSEAAGAAMFGGGITAEREYKKESGSITVQIITDSPMMQSMMMMFSNPMFATADGGKFERIGRQKAIVKYDNNSKGGDIKIVVANRYLVSIEGRRVSVEDLKAYANAIDYKKLQALP